MEKKLFGTDGIRGVAGEPPLDSPTVFAVGRCLGEYLLERKSCPRVLVGQDPRESSPWIAETVAGGLDHAGVEIVTTGVVTTPGLAHLVVSDGFTAGVMISASHNPYLDNGIKVFASTGYKLPDEDELAVERNILAALENSPAASVRRIPEKPNPALVRKYIDFLRRSAGSWSLPGRKLVLDCANGSASTLAREVFSNFGLELRIVADQPDGKNINHHCGSLHLDNLRRAVLEERADLGVAFDGDADRALFVTGRGVVVDGDGVLLAAGRFLKQRGALNGGAIVGTVMSNLGLEHILAREGLKLLRTPVGDKYVLEEMLRSGANLGGEQSGHVIFRDLAPTGDGMLTALQMLRIMAERGQTLEQLVEGLVVFPQKIRNVRVREKVPLETLPRVMDQIESSRRSLGEAGRLLVRYSGTELLARVMVEAETDELVERHTAAIARAIEETIGA